MHECAGGRREGGTRDGGNLGAVKRTASASTEIGEEMIVRRAISGDANDCALKTREPGSVVLGGFDRTRSGQRRECKNTAHHHDRSEGLMA